MLIQKEQLKWYCCCCFYKKQEIKCEFKRTLAESEIRIKQAAHKLGNSIDAAKPYYESRIYATQVQIDFNLISIE